MYYMYMTNRHVYLHDKNLMIICEVTDGGTFNGELVDVSRMVWELCSLKHPPGYYSHLSLLFSLTLFPYLLIP